MRPWHAILAAAVVGPTCLAAGMVPVVVNQVGRRFSTDRMSIDRGQVIRFHNGDEFTHHVYVQSPLFSVNSGEQEPGHDIDIAFSNSGTFDVRCEIHPKMRLTVDVH